MQADVVGGHVEQLRHLRLGQPDGLALRAQLDAAGAVLAGVGGRAGHGNCFLALCSRQTQRKAITLIYIEFSFEFLCGPLISLCTVSNMQVPFIEGDS